MTREEQIKQEAEEQAKELYLDKHNLKWMFKHGAEWADEHPSEEIQRLKTMFESDPDAYEQGYKDAIDKAFRWLLKQMFELNDCGEIYVADGDASSIKEFLDNFKKAMEEQR